MDVSAAAPDLVPRRGLSVDQRCARITGSAVCMRYEAMLSLHGRHCCDRLCSLLLCTRARDCCHGARAARRRARPSPCRPSGSTQEFAFYFQSQTTFYSCSSLEAKLERILKALGVQRARQGALGRLPDRSGAHAARHRERQCAGRSHAGGDRGARQEQEQARARGAGARREPRTLQRLRRFRRNGSASR